MPPKGRGRAGKAVGRGRPRKVRQDEPDGLEKVPRPAVGSARKTMSLPVSPGECSRCALMTEPFLEDRWEGVPEHWRASSVLQRFKAFQTRLDDEASEAMASMVEQLGPETDVPPPVPKKPRLSQLSDTDAERVWRDYYSKVWIRSIVNPNIRTRNEGRAKEQYNELYRHLDRTMAMQEICNEDRLEEPISKALQQAIYDHLLQHSVQLLDTAEGVHQSRLSLLQHVFNDPGPTPTHSSKYTQKDPALKTAAVDRVIRDLDSGQGALPLDISDSILHYNEDYWTLTAMPSVTLNEDGSSLSSDSLEEEPESPARSPIRGSSVRPGTSKVPQGMDQPRPAQLDDVVPETQQTVELLMPSLESFTGKPPGLDRSPSPRQAAATRASPRHTSMTRTSPGEDSPLTRKHNLHLKNRTRLIFDLESGAETTTVDSSADQTTPRAASHADQATELLSEASGPAATSELRGEMALIETRLESFVSPRGYDDLELTLASTVIPQTQEVIPATLQDEAGVENLAMPSREQSMPARDEGGIREEQDAQSRADELLLAKERIKHALEKPIARAKPAMSAKSRTNVVSVEPALPARQEELELGPDRGAPAASDVTTGTSEAPMKPASTMEQMQVARDHEEHATDDQRDRYAHEQPAMEQVTVLPPRTLVTIDIPSEPLGKTDRSKTSLAQVTLPPAAIAKSAAVSANPTTTTTAAPPRKVRPKPVQAPPKKIVVGVPGASKKVVPGVREQKVVLEMPSHYRAEATGGRNAPAEAASQVKGGEARDSVEQQISSFTASANEEAAAAAAAVVVVVGAPPAAQTTKDNTALIAPPSRDVPFTTTPAAAAAVAAVAPSTVQLPTSTPPGSPPEIYDSDASDRPDGPPSHVHATPEWARGPLFLQLLGEQHKKMPNLGGRMASQVNMKELIGVHLPRGDSPFGRP